MPHKLPVSKDEEKKYLKDLEDKHPATFEGVDADQEYMRHKVCINNEAVFPLKSAPKQEHVQKPVPQRQPPPPEEDPNCRGQRVSYAGKQSKVEKEYDVPMTKHNK